jgi:hypothetical protein
MKMVYLAMALAGRVAAAPRRREGSGGGRVETLREGATRYEYSLRWKLHVFSP